MALIVNDNGRQVLPTDYSLIPETTIEILRRYINGGMYWHAGDFIEAILLKDFYRAMLMADENNQVAMVAIMAWCHTYMPGNAWGSLEAVDNWKKAAYQARERVAEMKPDEPAVFPVEQREDVVLNEESKDLANEIAEELGWEDDDEG